MTDVTGQPLAAGNPAPAGESNPPAWYSGFEDPELRGFAELKGWKDPATAVGSYRQLEQHIGVPPERLLKLPEKADAPEWAGIREKLGFAPPATAADYKLPVPDGVDPGFAAKASEWFHKAGVPREMAVALAEQQNAFVAEQMAADSARIQAEDEADMTSLKSEWGARFDESSELARRAAKEVGALTGLNQEALDNMEASMGPRAFLKLWAAIGSKTQGEAPLHGSSEAGTGLMSPDVAKARLAALKADPGFFKRWNDGDAQAIAQFENLSRIAAGAPRG